MWNCGQALVHKATGKIHLFEQFAQAKGQSEMKLWFLSSENNGTEIEGTPELVSGKATDYTELVSKDTGIIYGLDCFLEVDGRGTINPAVIRMYENGELVRRDTLPERE